MRQHFDKLLLAVLSVLIMALGAVAVAVKSDKGLDWAIQSESMVMGAIVALATGRAIANGGKDHIGGTNATGDQRDGAEVGPDH